MGFSSELFMDEVDSNFVCPICKDVFEDCVRTTCEHHFCCHCIGEWLEMDVSQTCPVCRKKIRVDDLEQDRLVCSVISNFKVKCINSHQGKSCSWEGKLEDVRRHGKECQIKVVDCRHKRFGCSWSGQRKDIDDHLQQCHYEALKDVLLLQRVDFCRVSKRLRETEAKLEHCEVALKASTGTWIDNVQVGDKIDAEDAYGHWYEATIIEKDNAEVTVHFEGWNSKFDEVIPLINRQRLAPLHFHTHRRRKKLKGRKFRDFEIGDMIDCKDTFNRWYESTVLQVSESGKQIFVHYENFPSVWDEWIDVDSSRLAPLRTHSASAALVRLVTLRQTV